MKTLANQYKLIKEGKGHKGVFLKEAKAKFPSLITNAATFNEASTILKQKGIISENYVDLQPINNPLERKKEGYETAFANFLAEAEAKAEEKKVSKEVEEDAEKNYDYKDEKDPNNMIFGQIQMGYYYEMKQEKNADKTIDEIKDIVFKNLAKDPIYYTKNGQFGVDVGYTDEAPSLGEPKEPKGEYKSSGYGKLEEHSLSIAGGLVTGGGFSSKDYKSFFGLNEDEEIIPSKDKVDANTAALKDMNAELEKTKELVGKDELKENFENEMADALATQAEEILRDAEARGEDLDIDKVLDMVMGDMRGLLKQHLEIFVRDLM
jgi:3-methyladenine DNA glycosylase Tag